MSVHVEWDDANYTVVEIAIPGQEVGEDEIEAGQIALVLGGDSIHVCTGTKSEVLALIDRIAALRYDLAFRSN